MKRLQAWNRCSCQETFINLYPTKDNFPYRIYIQSIFIIAAIKNMLYIKKQSQKLFWN